MEKGKVKSDLSTQIGMIRMIFSDLIIVMGKFKRYHSRQGQTREPTTLWFESP
jgi:hypothetical protein